MTPVPYRVADRWRETGDTVTLRLEPLGRPIGEPRPGQFTMMYAFGIGEVPISVSRAVPIEQTVRAAGAVSRAIHGTRTGGVLGLRGPYGTGWDLDGARGRDLVFAGGVVCGPEIMMRLTAEALVARGVPAADVRLSLERNMRCGVAWCGHCQLGPLLLCRDGPVVAYETAAPLMAVKEL
ncbi:hypothetical protein ACFY4C_37820 [Actinomadura viridis]|uniref:iron-sulfur cluster-binding protein n=1 Tax=Actinomadura viridis TaxID=58110 RepID=UPI0036795559